MRKYLLLFLIVVSFNLYSENKVSFKTMSNRIEATITLDNEEYITLNEDFFYLMVESDKYTFKFSGYPKGEININGETVYFGKVILAGELELKENILPDDYLINVILGYQSCTKDGMCNIPVEVSENILVKNNQKILYIPIGIGLLIILIVIVLLVKRRKN
ncbi:MAG: hypothetical protein JXR64_05680 [Spirochaetales bacterium]|nr:hypothetical protein [Spirochaetales bacterium]